MFPYTGQMMGGITKVDLIISSNVSNYNVADEVATALGGAPTNAVEVTVTINSSIIVNASAYTNGAAFQSGTLPSESTIDLTITSTAFIRGYGGLGTTDAILNNSARGTIFAGGDGIDTSVIMTIDNQGEIAAGGGGGGSQAISGSDENAAGGGGAGSPVGAGGNGRNENNPNMGAVATTTTGGGGDLEYGGGTGGARGANGANGTGGVGCKGGAYIVGDSLVTWTTTGTRYGIAVS